MKMMKLRNYPVHLTCLLVLIIMLLAWRSIPVGAQGASDWPQVQNNPQHTGYTSETLGANLQVAWTHPFQPERVHPQVQAIVCDGKVLVGTESGNAYALNAITGSGVWTTTLSGPILASAACDSTSNRVFWGAMDGAVYGLNLDTGAIEWKRAVSSRLGFSTAPILADNRVLIGGRNGHFYAFDYNGALRWDYDVGAPILQTAAADGGRVYFGAMNMRLHALYIADSPPGGSRLAWRSERVPGMAFKDYWPLIHQGKVYIIPTGRKALGVSDGAQVINAAAQQAVLADYAAHPENYEKSMHVFDALSGQEAPAVIYYPYQTMHGAPSPPCVDRDGYLVIPALNPSGEFPTGWGRLNPNTRIVVDALKDTSAPDLGYGNGDETFNVTCSNNLIFTLQTQEGNAHDTGFFNLDTRRWTQIWAGHTNGEMSTNTQGGGGNPASIVNGMVYHISFHELIARSTSPTSIKTTHVAPTAETRSSTVVRRPIPIDRSNPLRPPLLPDPQVWQQTNYRTIALPDDRTTQQLSDPQVWQQTATGMKRSEWGYTAGLEMIIHSNGGWPSLNLRGGIANAGWRNILGPVGIQLGAVQVTGYPSATLLSESVDWAHDELTFGYGASSQLKVWAARASPAILIQSPANALKLLTGNVAGNEFYINDYDETEIRETLGPAYPKYVAFPTAGGIQTRTLSAGATSLAGLNQNWLLVWYGSNSHFLDSKAPLSYSSMGWDAASLPNQHAYRADAPLLLVFQNQPNSIRHASGGGIELSFGAASGYLSVLPLLGREHLNATTTESWASGLPGAITQKAQGWANRLCAYPTTVSETYGYDAGNDTALITETVSFLNVCAGGARFAPIPPMLSLAKDALGVTFSGPIVDASYPTEFGPLFGVENTDRYTWRVTGLRDVVDVTRQLGAGQAPSDLQQTLISETQELIAGGRWAPWIFMDDVPINPDRGDLYWANPADSLYQLIEVAEALPSGTTRNNLINYIRNERTAYPPEDVYDLELDPYGGGGTRRQYFSYYGHNWDWYWEVSRTDAHLKDTPLYNFYALARYHDLTGDPLPANLMSKAHTVLDRDMREQDWANLYWFYGFQDRFGAVVNANRHFAGLVGFVRLANRSGDQAAGDLGRALLAKAAVLRIGMARYPRYLYSSGLSVLPADPDWQPRYSAMRWRGHLFNYDWDTAYDDARQVVILDQHEVHLYDHSGFKRQDWDTGEFSLLFMPYLIAYRDMTPELGRLLADHARADAEINADKFAAYVRDWYAAFAEAVLGMEHNLNFPIDSFQVFMTKAWIQGESAANLAGYVDVPWLEAGDLFYLQKLAETIKTYRGWSWENVLGFTLSVNPSMHSIEPGGVATYTLHLEPTGGFTDTITLLATSPSPSLTLDLQPAMIAPPGQAVLMLTDLHTGDISPGLWYTVPITATGGGVTQSRSVTLLVGGARLYLPVIARSH